MNSLPENASVIVNHRIAIHDSVRGIKDYYIALLTPWARKWHFNLHAFGVEDQTRQDSVLHLDNNADCGDVTLTAEYELESSPVSDTDDARFRWLAQTIKGVFGDDVVVAPELLSGTSMSHLRLPASGS